MFLENTIKSAYSPAEVKAASEHVANINLNSKAHLALNQKNKEALVTLLIGENDPYKVAPIGQKIYEKCNEYFNIVAGDPADKKTPISKEDAEKIAITRELVDLNKQLEKALPKEAYSKLTTKFNALTAFYPITDFMHLEYKQPAPEVAKGDSLKYSQVLSSTESNPELRGNKFISVSPPTSGASYNYMGNVFGNATFLAFCMKSSSISAWSKYANGRSVPVALNWGVMLLGLGLHPLYKLTKRDNIAKVIKTPLFKDVFPNFKDTFNFKAFNKYSAYDLLPYTANKSKLDRNNFDYAGTRQMFKEHMTNYFANGNKHPDFKNADDLINTIFDLHEKLHENQKYWRDINDIILKLSNIRAINQTETRQYVTAFSIDHEFDESTASKILKNTSVAGYLQLEANPSPNMYLMLRHLAHPTADIMHISKNTGISNETWIRYEQGTRIPHSAAWASILASLDIHPIYQVVKRTDKTEIQDMFDVYMDLHYMSAAPAIDSNTHDEFYVKPGTTFEEYYEQYFS